MKISIKLETLYQPAVIYFYKKFLIFNYFIKR